MVSYARQTLDTPNPLARWAHRSRYGRCLRILQRLPPGSRVLDYGCGAGSFLARLQDLPHIRAIGYEPFLEERAAKDLSIHQDLEGVADEGPFDLITILETLEHLEHAELVEFCLSARRLLKSGGWVYASVPIEIGPALLMKELNRCLLHRRRCEYSLRELLAAALLGKAAPRADDIKCSHKGFDFRATLRFLRRHWGAVALDGYGPLPLSTWYGNSQAFFWARPVEVYPLPKSGLC